MSTRACLFARTKESLFNQRSEPRGVAEIQVRYKRGDHENREGSGNSGHAAGAGDPARRCAGLILKKIVADEPVSRILCAASRR